jgi:hypothetical protein
MAGGVLHGLVRGDEGKERPAQAYLPLDFNSHFAAQLQRFEPSYLTRLHTQISKYMR